MTTYLGGAAMPDLNSTAAAIITAGAALAVLGAWWRWWRPKWRAGRSKVSAALDAVVGREAITHPDTGKELVPAQPGIGVRMARSEEQMTILTEAVAKIADSHERLANHEVRLEQHDQRIAALEDAAVERVVTRAESLQAWKAIEEVAKHAEDLDASAIED